MAIATIIRAAPLQAAGREVEKELQDVAEGSAFTAKMAAMYSYAQGRGMRFRPLLLYLGSFLCGGDGRGLAPLGAALELVHKASLLHDDLIDGDILRREQRTFHCCYGEREAVVTGDLLLGAAFGKASDLRANFDAATCLEVQRQLSGLIFTLSRGVLREIELEGDFEKREAIFEVMYEKTAVFLESCLVLGGLLGGAGEKERLALATLGRNLGLVFQIINDFNNVRAAEKAQRGRAGQDLEQQKATLLSYSLCSAAGGVAGSLPADETRLLELAAEFYRPLLKRCAASLEELEDSFWKTELLDLEGCVRELWNWGKGFADGGEPAAGAVQPASAPG